MDAEREESQEEDSGPLPIAALKEKGINAGDIKKLEDAGFRSVESVLFKARKDLLQIKGLSEGKLDKIIEAARQLVKGGFQTANKFFLICSNKKSKWLFLMLQFISCAFIIFLYFPMIFLIFQLIHSFFHLNK